MTSAANRERDRQVLKRIARGEVRALRELYDKHAGCAMAIAMGVLKRRSDAEDVVQETFIELWKRSSTFDPGRGSARALIVTMARSRAIDRLRADDSAARAVEAAAFELEPRPHSVPEELMNLQQDSHRVTMALRALPAKQRSTIELSYFQGLTQREIARETGEPLGTVKMRVQLAMTKLSSMLGRDP